MKKSRFLLCIITVCCVVLSLCMPTYAEDLNAEDEITSICTYFSESGQSLDTAEEIVLFKSVGAIQGSSVPDVWQDTQSDAVNYANAVLAALALGQDPETPLANGDNALEKLAGLQQDDGSFGDLEQTVYCAVALQSAQQFVGEDRDLYSEQNACYFLLSLQEEDGGFGSVYKTAQAIIYLAQFKDETVVKEALTKAVVDYLQIKQVDAGGFEDTDIRTICAVICALSDMGETLSSSTWKYMPLLLVRYKNEDGTYRLTPDGEEVCDERAQLAALSAFDATLSSQSAYARLMTHGTYAASVWKNIKDYVLLYGGLAVLSLVFWGYILFGRKKAVDKPEGDRYDAAN